MQMSYRPAAISRSWAGQNWGRQFNAFLVIAVTMKWAQHNGNRKHKQEKKNRIRSNFLLHVQIYDPLRSFNFSTTNVPWLWLLTQRIIPIDLIHQVNHFLRDPPGPLKEVGFPANVIHAGRNHWFLHFFSVFRSSTRLFTIGTVNRSSWLISAFKYAWLPFTNANYMKYRDF